MTYTHKLQSCLLTTGHDVEAMIDQPPPDAKDLILALYYFRKAMDREDMKAMRKWATQLVAMVVKLQIEKL